MPFKNMEVQPELFGTVKKNRAPGRFEKRWFSGNFNTEITISCDTLIVIIIAVVMANLLMYVFGIEQGKQLVAQQLNRAPAPVARPSTKIQLATRAAAAVAEVPVTSLPAPAQKIPDVDAPATDAPLNPVTTKGYVIQLVTYTKDKTAQKEVERLQSAGTKSFYLKKGNYFVVYAGKFPNRELADVTLKTLRKEYRDCFLKLHNQES